MDSPAPVSITDEELKLLPLKLYDGPIRVVHQRKDVHKALADISSEKILGFDTETKPVFVKGVSHPPALLQIATCQEVIIFQLSRMDEWTDLHPLLTSSTISKAGVALYDDLKKLREISPFEPAGFVEIGHMAKSAGLNRTGLRPLAGILLGFRISKKEQRSNWAKPDLSHSQIRYAATDAWVSREIYLRLHERLSNNGTNISS